ncbi:uncharacterized protein HMF8227_00480 [Saliniradius amylolyticus]|uniref:Uncharacterized protein n=1 Tax=Saliniradius amylolyticus TaxID=2183582 RepID=A0A2S2E026_9ALTE|nr:Na/Pi symporter [Saliniradius amylolyticus]AWL10976.1 uncharacterized protein HMF8227_00480 [Saliniradius amylolyticus]
MNWGEIIGFLGLFLTGMWLMTEGLKVAGGNALKSILKHWINSRWRGFVAGVAITGLVQSSSAVTVATIGFVNARLMTFAQSVWVVFGSNVGTTLTAWLVTLIGFKFQLTAITLPIIGIGAFLRIFSPYVKGQSLGMALAGFGLLFMGIDGLGGAFTGISPDSLSFDWLESPVAVGALLGLLLTALTQSSSAAIAIVLTASATGVAGIDMAAAAVIGANVGTTSTAMLASFGATAAAKRLISMHVLFNVITASVALLLLPLLLIWVGDSVKADNIPMFLAIFHSCFNLLGAVIMVFLEPKLSHWLLQKFRRQRKALNIDKSLASVPALAADAIDEQLHVLFAEISRFALLHKDEKGALRLYKEQAEGLDEFIRQTAVSPLTQAQSQQLTSALSVLDRLNSTLDACLELQQLLPAEHLPGEVVNWLQQHQEADSTADWQAFTNSYNALRKAIIGQQLSSGDDALYVDESLRLIALFMQIKRKLREAWRTGEPVSIETLPEVTQN